MNILALLLLSAQAAEVPETPVYFLGRTGWQVSAPAGYTPCLPGKPYPEGWNPPSPGRPQPKCQSEDSLAFYRAWTAMKDEPVKVGGVPGFVRHRETITIMPFGLKADVPPAKALNRECAQGTLEASEGKHYEKPLVRGGCRQGDQVWESLVLILDSVPQNGYLNGIGVFRKYNVVLVDKYGQAGETGFSMDPKKAEDTRRFAAGQKNWKAPKDSPFMGDFKKLLTSLKPTAKGLTSPEKQSPDLPQGETGTIKLLR
jgi:hypothetical protein